MPRLVAFVAVVLLAPLAQAMPTLTLNPQPPPLPQQTPSSFPPAQLQGYYVVQDHSPVTEKAKPAAPQPATTSDGSNSGNGSATTNAPSNASNSNGAATTKGDGAPMPAVLGTSWSYYQADDGSLWRARRKSGSSFALWGSGLALIGVAFAFSAPMGGYEPIVGGFVGAANYNYIPALMTLSIIDGLVGVTGAVLVITGAVYGKGGVQKERIPLTRTAYIGGGGSGGLAVHF